MLAQELDAVLRPAARDWDALRGRHIAVTGGTGFVGRWLLEAFVRANDSFGLGAVCTVLTRTPAKFTSAAPALARHPALRLVEGDVRTASFPHAHWYGVVHAAADPQERFDAGAGVSDVIVGGTRRMLAEARDRGASKFLLISSGAVYGTLAGRPAVESMELDDGAAGLSVYARSKREAERLCLAVPESVETTVARLFAFVGPLLPLDGQYAIGNFIGDGLAGRPVTVQGNGDSVRSYLYAADMAAWLWKVFLRGAPRGIYNVGSGDALTITDIARRTARQFNPHRPVRYTATGADAGPATYYVPSVEKITTELGVRASTDITTALSRTIAWHSRRFPGRNVPIMTVSDYIARFLAAQGVEAVFEMAGGMITYMLDALSRSGQVRIISMHHEQAAAFAADAWARTTGRPGVAFATSGPGATNLLTGIAGCYFDSTPAVFITGQVNTHEQKASRGVRQLGFQETDIVSMASPVTKAAIAIRRPEQIRSALIFAFETAMSGRPGPVLIDIPMDLQRAELEIDPPFTVVRSSASLMPDEFSFDELERDIRQSVRPMILAGGGVRSAHAQAAFARFVDCVKVPVVTSLMALDALPYEHRQRTGFIGSYGNRWANQALALSDLLIVVGSRLDIRQTGADAERFREGKKIYHIDCDESEINNRITGCTAVVADAATFLASAAAAFDGRAFRSPGAWMNEIENMRALRPDTAELQTNGLINPNAFMHVLSRTSKDAHAFIADVGNHQMWCAQSLELTPGQRFITSGGMGAMGFALPAAIGASIAGGSVPVVVVAGDGGFQLNIQELQTIVHHRLPVKIVVMNNHCLGMIRQFQDSYFNSRYQSTVDGYSAPDFEAVAGVYGIPSMSISRTDESAGACRWLWEHTGGPCLLQVRIGTHINAYPKIAFGRPINEMEPFAVPTGIEGT